MAEPLLPAHYHTPAPDPHVGHGEPAAVTMPDPDPQLVAWSWQPDWSWIGASIVLAGLYLAAVVIVARRGVRWPAGRTVGWLLGILSLLGVTSTGVAMLGTWSLTWHMVQHMTLSMVTPILLLIGRPVTLALRVLPATGRGSGLRRAVLAVLHWPLLRLAIHPAVALPLFFGSLFVLYFSPVFDVLMATHLGHQAMLVHFLLAGLLLFLPLLATEPLPGRVSPGVRMGLLAATLPLHALFGVSVMSAPSLISQRFATAAVHAGVDPFADQRMAGGFAWAFGEIPALIAAAVIFTQWYRHDRRSARHADALAERHLDDYNRRLSQLTRRHEANPQ